MVTGATRALALAAAASLALAGCSGDDDAPGDEPSVQPVGGGTLTYYIHRKVEHLDPQRVYVGRDLANLSRTVYRSWVTFPISDDVQISTTHVPDLATDEGRSENGARTWKFTLKDGPTWEDGKPVTCQDFRYGASRVFATDVITFGPDYLLTYLDIPTNPKTGLPAYEGPYSKVGQDLYDKAVTCDGKTITYRFKKPWPDFPLAIAALHMMDPYRADKDHGDESEFQIFSNGPYKLAGAWDEEKGGTLVRNDSYDAATDSTNVRRAHPDRIVFDLGRSAEEINELLIADHGKDRAAVTDERIPPEYHDQITGAVADRAVTVVSPFTDYLVPNFRRLTDLRVRQALAMALDDTAWVEAAGGDKAYEQATDILNPAVTGYQKRLFPGGAGDPAKAKQLLESAGVELPYPILYTFPNNPSARERAAALEKGWEKAGFKVTFDVVTEDTYFGSIQNPDQLGDIVYAGWGADWPSAITVIPPLFDSRPNLTEDSNGQDYGAYQSDGFEDLVDEAHQATDLDKQTALLQQADQVLAKDVAYIPLGTAVFYLLRGSDVTGYLNSAGSNGYADLGAIGVE